MYILINAILNLDYNEWIGKVTRGYLYFLPNPLGHTRNALMKKSCSLCTLFVIKRPRRETFLSVFLSLVSQTCTENKQKAFTIGADAFNSPLEALLWIWGGQSRESITNSRLITKEQKPLSIREKTTSSKIKTSMAFRNPALKHSLCLLQTAQSLVIILSH